MTWASQRRLAKRCNLGERTVRDALKLALKEQWLTRRPFAREGSRGWVSEYSMTCPSELRPADIAGQKQQRPAAFADQKPLRPADFSERPADNDVKTGSCRRRTSKNYIELDSDQSFDQFWELYPRKEGKLKAKEIWKARKLGDLAHKILPDIENRRNFCEQWKDKKYIPHPKTYLSQERWKDEWRSDNSPNSETGLDRAKRIADQLGIQPKTQTETDEQFSDSVCRTSALLRDFESWATSVFSRCMVVDLRGVLSIFVGDLLTNNRT